MSTLDEPRSRTYRAALLMRTIAPRFRAAILLGVALALYRAAG